MEMVLMYRKTCPNLYTQEIMSDFYGSLQEATKSGIVYGEKITEGNWEFIFAQSRQIVIF